MDVENIVEGKRALSQLFFFIPLALALLLVAFFTAPMRTGGYIECEARVTQNVEKIRDDKKEYEVHFTYTVDGEVYENHFTFSEKKPIGSVFIFYRDPNNPNAISNVKNNGWQWLIFLAGGLAAGAYSVYIAVKTSRKIKKNRALREEQLSLAPEKFAPPEGSEQMTEYYFLWDGNNFKPGYLIEDRSRVPVFEGKMLNNGPLKNHKFEFVNHFTGSSKEHTLSPADVEYVFNEFFPQTSTIKFDGSDIWEYLKSKGLSVRYEVGAKRRQMSYEIFLNGEFLAKALSSGIYVHEEDEKGKKIVYSDMFYRIWTKEDNLELIFTFLFALTQTIRII